MRTFLSNVSRVPGGRIAIAVVSVVLFGLFFAAGAQACSCAPTPPAESLARSDAAVAGRLLAVEAHGRARAEYRYRVLHVYRGREEIQPGSVLTVLSSRESSACALPTRVGHRYGLFLLGSGGHWASGLCGVLSPHRLWVAAEHPDATAQSGPGAGFSCTS
jgi:hypothetical protein